MQILLFSHLCPLFHGIDHLSDTTTRSFISCDVLHQLLHQQILFSSNFKKFIRHYLKKKFCHRFLIFSRFTQPPLLPPPTPPQRRKSTNMMKVSSYSVTVKHYTVYLKKPTANTLIPTPKNTEELKKQ